MGEEKNLLKIERIDTTTLELPLKKVLVTATNKFVTARGLLVKVVSEDGVEGYGYADLFPRTGESPESGRQVIEGVLAPKLAGRDLQELTRLNKEINHRVAGNPRAKGALDVALHDALSRSMRAPLCLLFGGRFRSAVRVVKMIGVDDPEAMAEEAKRVVREGYGALKLKASGKMDLDLNRVAAVRKAVGDEVFIKVDANEAYDAKSAIRLAKGMAEQGVEIFEQPVPRAQIDALWEVKKYSPVKVEADQAVRTVEDAYHLVRNRMVDAINTSIQKAGGIHEVRKIAELCEQAGVRCALSNTAGSMVGDAAALHLAAAIPGISEFAELGEFENVTGDPFTGLRVERGSLGLPQGDGLGVTPTLG